MNVKDLISKWNKQPGVEAAAAGSVSSTSSSVAASTGTGAFKMRSKPLESEASYKYDVAWLMAQQEQLLSGSGAADFVKGISADRAREVLASMTGTGKEETARYKELCVRTALALEVEELFDIEELFVRKLLEFSKDAKEEVEVRKRLAQCFCVQGKFQEAFEAYSLVLGKLKQFSGSGNDIEMARVLSQMAMTLHEQNKHEEAEKFYRESLEIQNAIRDKIVKQREANAAAEAAASSSSSSVTYTPSSKDWRKSKAIHSLVTNNLAAAVHEQGKLDEAERLYRSIIEKERHKTDAETGSVSSMDDEDDSEIAQLLDDSAGLTRSNLGSLLNSKGDFEEAESMFRKSIQILGHDHASVAVSLNHLSKLLEKQKKMEFNQVGGAHGNIVSTMGIISKKEDDAEAFDTEARFYETVASSTDPIADIMPGLFRVVRDATPRILMLEDITQLVLSPTHVREKSSVAATRGSKTRSETKTTSRPISTAGTPFASADAPIKGFIVSTPVDSPSNNSSNSESNNTKSPSDAIDAVGEANCSIMDCKLGFRSFRHDAPNVPEAHYFTKYHQLEQELGLERANEIWKIIPRSTGSAQRPKCLEEGKLGKHDYLSFRDATTTSLQYGFRLTAFRNVDITVSQEESKAIASMDQFMEKLKLYLAPQGKHQSISPATLSTNFIADLQVILRIVKQSEIYKKYDFIGTSLLFVHHNERTAIKWIDFANVREPQSSDQNGIVKGIEALIECLKQFV